MDDEKWEIGSAEYNEYCEEVWASRHVKRRSDEDGDDDDR